jgi:phosphoribosyl 1,2-cyclic phosphodiesterase
VTTASANKPPTAQQPRPARVKFWGVRGTVPTPGPDTVHYGGNTSCIELRADGEIIILDAGTGLRPLGRALELEFSHRPLNLTLLLTHTHWDHIHGLPYFLPIYNTNHHVRILAYKGARKGLNGIISGQMESHYFPVGFNDLPGNVTIEEFEDLEFNVGNVRVQVCFANHPGTCVGYRLFTSGGSVAFFPDNETRYRHVASPPPAARGSKDVKSARAEKEKLVEFLRRVDVLIIDAQFTAEEYKQHAGWGHGCVDDVVALGLKAQAKQLFLFHHDPDHDDAQVARMVEHARHLVAAQRGSLLIEAAREGLTVELSAKARSRPTS